MNCAIRSFAACALLFLLAEPAAAQGASPPAITSPAPGQVLQGQVTIMGSSEVPGFAFSELAFAYVSDPSGTWFIIQTSSQPVVNDLLATWDTAALTDGDYNLRLRVYLQDGSFLDVTAAGLQVRNYTPTSTPTQTLTPTPIPTPSALPPTNQPTPAPATNTPTPTPQPTPSPLPANPAAVTPPEVYASFQRGALVIGFLFLAFGLFLRLRRTE